MEFEKRHRNAKTSPRSRVILTRKFSKLVRAIKEERKGGSSPFEVKELEEYKRGYCLEGIGIFPSEHFLSSQSRDYLAGVKSRIKDNPSLLYFRHRLYNLVNYYLKN